MAHATSVAPKAKLCKPSFFNTLGKTTFSPKSAEPRQLTVDDDCYSVNAYYEDENDYLFEPKPLPGNPTFKEDRAAFLNKGKGLPGASIPIRNLIGKTSSQRQDDWAHVVSKSLPRTPVTHTRLSPKFNADVEDVELRTEEAPELSGPGLTVRKNRKIRVKGQPPTRVSERNRNKAFQPLVPETIKPVESTLINDICLKIESDTGSADENDDFSSVKSHNDLEVEQDLERTRERVDVDLRWKEKVETPADDQSLPPLKCSSTPISRNTDDLPFNPIGGNAPASPVHLTRASREDAAAGAKASLALTKTACSASEFRAVDIAIDRSNSSQQQQPHPARRSSRIQHSLRITLYDKSEKTRLIQKLSTAENQIKQVSETAEQLQKEIKVLADKLDKASTEKINLKKNLLDFTSKNLEKDLQELQDRVRGQENQIIFLENREKEYKKLQVKFIETEDSNDSRLDEDEPGEITKLVGDINELTLPTDSGDKKPQNANRTLKQNNHLFGARKSTAKKKGRHGRNTQNEDTSEKTFANTCKKNPKDDDIPATEQDDEDAKKVNRYFTQPLVKALGELFFREDKKAIPIFKGKSKDKLVSGWLRGAEHVARNNEWDDNQKIRFFSDRFKGEAFEWHENYAEEKGDDLNYQDWEEALIKRFQDTYDLATLEKKLSKLTQKPEENCRAFVSRLNNLYDTIAGKEERADHNQTIIEGQLLNKV
ncbi:hypothetical protein OUZ56_032825 [Daphnia magna]|uniref:Ty3 transposon capsid-like protein domain-containing protein n=1 Tax=Daphnia magna TaxID=35525 RepID=A0ABR0B9P0_9CRUS|nr:hypothetical protein OUZ56_032825 [Daphnia magna]